MKLIQLLFCLLFVGFSPSNNLINKAIQIQKKYNLHTKNYVVLIDFSKSIDEERLYVVNTKTAKIEISSKVSHGLNSGKNYATVFSNKMNSYQSSLGAYLTGKTYYGRFGYSLKVKGLDNTNSNAESRTIVFHSSKSMHNKWSQGCFSLPDEKTKQIINLIKEGCLVYAFK